LDGVQELGFDGVELAAFPPHLAPEDFPTRASRLEIKKMLDDRGLGVSGLAADFNNVPPAVVKPSEYIEVVLTNPVS
jgi:sugar phosphate isomerase/epimerase